MIDKDRDVYAMFVTMPATTLFRLCELMSKYCNVVPLELKNACVKVFQDLEAEMKPRNTAGGG